MPMITAIVMDPIETIHIKKDSSFAMLLEATRRGHTLWYLEQKDLFCRDGQVFGMIRTLTVEDNPAAWFHLGEAQEKALSDVDILLMRKDPPFDIEYVYTTQLLSLLEEQGVLVVNRPQSLRDYNEKLATTHFPQCTPPLLVSRDKQALLDFFHEQEEVVFKPLEGMGGRAVFHCGKGDVNAAVIIETLSASGQRFMMAQRYIPEIVQGDKRILMINGEPLDYALARIPSAGDHRGNLARGAQAKGIPLSDRDRDIASIVGPFLREKGLWFVGLDVIGDYLTEINVTSPTCIRELDALFNLNIAGLLFDFLESKRHAARA